MTTLHINPFSPPFWSNLRVEKSLGKDKSVKDRAKTTDSSRSTKSTQRLHNLQEFLCMFGLFSCHRPWSMAHAGPTHIQRVLYLAVGTVLTRQIHTSNYIQQLLMRLRRSVFNFEVGGKSPDLPSEPRGNWLNANWIPWKGKMQVGKWDTERERARARIVDYCNELHLFSSALLRFLCTNACRGGIKALPGRFSSIRSLLLVYTEAACRNVWPGEKKVLPPVHTWMFRSTPIHSFLIPSGFSASVKWIYTHFLLLFFSKSIYKNRSLKQNKKIITYRKEFKQ